MTPRDRLRIAKVAIFATLFGWGVLTGMAAGSKYQDATDWPFSELVTVALAVMITVSALLAILPATRVVGRAIGFSAAAFVVAVLIGHLIGNNGPGRPEVPRGTGRGTGPLP